MHPQMTSKIRQNNCGRTIRVAILIVAVVIFQSRSFAQNGSSAKNRDTTSLTLAQALDYAMANNADVKNAYADLANAQQSVKEVTAIGLPKVSGSLALQDAIQKQVFVFPVNGVPMPIRIGNKYTTQMSINANWLIADGTYFLGLKSAKQFTDLSRKAASKTETDVKVDVAKTYFMCLITKENISLVDSTYSTLSRTFREVKALNKEGFTESLDVDRLKLQLNNLDISRKKLRDQYEIVLGLLKSKIGMEQSQPLKIVDNIDMINNSVTEIDTSGVVNMNNRTDYQVLQQQLVLNKLNVKRYQYGKYPNLAAAFVYNQSNFGEKIDYAKDKWYDNYYVALQVNVPIFNGFANDAKIQKAKIDQWKTENTIVKVKNLIELDAIQSRLKYMRAMDYVMQQRENLMLATRILNVTTVKYNEGVGSNLELITANQDLKTTQTNYLSAVYDLLVAKLDLIVATGQPIKF